MIKRTFKKALPPAFFLILVFFSYVGLKPTGQLSAVESIAAESVKIPAPKQGEKKVVLSDLGMA